jgi:hypothetical protein
MSECVGKEETRRDLSRAKLAFRLHSSKAHCQQLGALPRAALRLPLLETVLREFEEQPFAVDDLCGKPSFC